MFFNRKLILFFLLIKILSTNLLNATEIQTDFKNWLDSYKAFAISKGISKKTIDITFKNVKYLPNVIKYDRKQPEFYEDTYTYIKKRTHRDKVKNGLNLYKKE